MTNRGGVPKHRFWHTALIVWGGLQQNLCHDALKRERRKKYEIGSARETRVFTFQTYTFFKGTCIPSKPYTVRV